MGRGAIFSISTEEPFSDRAVLKRLTECPAGLKTKPFGKHGYPLKEPECSPDGTGIRFVGFHGQPDDAIVKPGCEPVDLSGISPAMPV